MISRKVFQPLWLERSSLVAVWPAGTIPGPVNATYVQSQALGPSLVAQVNSSLTTVWFIALLISSGFEMFK